MKEFTLTFIFYIFFSSTCSQGVPFGFPNFLFGGLFGGGQIPSISSPYSSPYNTFGMGQIPPYNGYGPPMPIGFGPPQRPTAPLPFPLFPPMCEVYCRNTGNTGGLFFANIQVTNPRTTSRTPTSSSIGGGAGTGGGAGGGSSASSQRSLTPSVTSRPTSGAVSAAVQYPEINAQILQSYPWLGSLLSPQQRNPGQLFYSWLGL